MKVKFLTIIILFGFINNAFSQNINSNYPKLTEQANQFRNAQEYQKAAETYELAFKMNHDMGKVYDRYLCAICWAKIQISDSALNQLHRIAYEGKFSHYDLVALDEAFFYLHKDTNFLDILDKMKDNYKKLK